MLHEPDFEVRLSGFSLVLALILVIIIPAMSTSVFLLHSRIETMATDMAIIREQMDAALASQQSRDFADLVKLLKEE